MNRLVHAALAAAGLAAVAAGACLPAFAAPPSPMLTSFGNPNSLSGYEMAGANLLTGADAAPLMIYGAPPFYALSTLLSPTAALDSGLNLDIGQRFDNYSGAPSPFLSAVTNPFLGLADGGRYAGLTMIAARDLRLRLGASVRSDRLDNFAFDPAAALGLPLLDLSQTRSIMAGLSWDISDRAGLGISAISSGRSGVPRIDTSGLAVSDRAQTNAVGVSAHLGLGDNWVSTMSYNEGFTQLDLRPGRSETQEQSYSIAIAKRDLLGNDALGFALSRPAPGMIGNFAALTAAGDLPPLMIAGQLPGDAQETDIQLGYVTSFLGGKMALQTNAAYQMNYQGQSGANAVSLLSRVKIKF